MKKYLFYIIALLGMATTLYGCKRVEPVQEEEVSPPPEISVKNPKTYPFIGDTYTISYSIKNPKEGVSLEVSSKDKWIYDLTVVNEKSVSFSLTANGSDKERSGKIEFTYEGAKSASVTIKQDRYTEDPVIIAPQPGYFDYPGGNGNIPYRVENPTEGIELKASSNVDWISDITVGEETVSFVVGANPIEEERSGKMELTYEGAEPLSIIIRQSKYIPPPEIKASQPDVFNYIGGKGSITYSIEYPRAGTELKASTNDDWIYGIQVGTETVSFSVDANQYGFKRNGRIILEYEGAEKLELLVSQDKCTATAIDLTGTANCYIITDGGEYMISAVKGNSSASIGKGASAEVLWETFGTKEQPNKGDLIESAAYGAEKVFFKVKSPMKEGNALIAVKDESGKILWSWHLWLTDRPVDQIYNNGAGIVMDRNLGATSATPGDITTRGLLYQWGRKDPFLGNAARDPYLSGDVHDRTVEYVKAKYAGEYFDLVDSDRDPSKGTIEYAIANPMTFINGNRDWYHYEKGAPSTDNTRWQSKKTIYDPCPPGYRVPDGDADGLWAKAFGQTGMFIFLGQLKFRNGSSGYNWGASSTGQSITAADVCWFPYTGYYLNVDEASAAHIWEECVLWTCSPSNEFTSNGTKVFVHALLIDYDLGVYVTTDYTEFPLKINRSKGCTVRCQKE